MTMQRTTSVTNRTTPTVASWSPNTASVTGVLQRQCACGTHTMGGGECAGCAKKKSSLQRKLTIGASNDPLEQEADRIAEQVMAGPVPSQVNSVPPHMQRFAGHAARKTDLAPLSVDRVLAGSGRPLDPILQREMEHRFSYDFSRVRVHTDAKAAESARDVNALAYTVDHDIVFGVGKFTPETHEGRRLLAHELSHVVQQRGGSRNLSEAQSSLSLSAVPSGYVQRQPQLPKFSQSTEEQIATLMQEHPGLSRVNAERAIIGPPGSIPTASGIPGAMGTGSAKMPKVPDIKFSQPTAHAKGSSTVLHREVKVWEGGQASFNDTLSKAADQLEAHGGGEVLVQVPKGTDARALVQKFKGGRQASAAGASAEAWPISLDQDHHRRSREYRAAC